MSPPSRRRGAVLGVGMGMLAVQRVSELRAVLGHEMGHLAGGHGRLRSLLLRARHGMLWALDDMGGSPAARLLAAYVRAYFRVTSGIWQVQEREADTRAVEACGRRAIVGGLESVAIASHALRSC